MTHYDVERWAEATTHGRHVFNYHFRMFGNELKGWERVKVVPMQETEDLTETVYVWQHEKDPARRVIRVGVDELDSWRSAHKRLQATLDHCMRPAIPTGTGRLAKVGDLNWVARDPRSDVPAAVLFARGNVCVSVNSVGDLNIDVSGVAESIDRALSEPPARGELGRRLARAIAPNTVVAKRNAKHLLIRSLSKIVPRDAWLKVLAPDGELRREGDQLVHVASKAGQRIGVYLMTPPRTSRAPRGQVT
jgi:hypothetical protein